MLKIIKLKSNERFGVLGKEDGLRNVNQGFLLVLDLILLTMKWVTSWCTTYICFLWDTIMKWYFPWQMRLRYLWTDSFYLGRCYSFSWLCDINAFEQTPWMTRLLGRRRYCWHIPSSKLWQVSFANTLWRYLVFSCSLLPAEDPDQQVLDFLKAVNDNLKIAFTPGDHICVDESMIKSFHKKLNGKVKIMRKPRPIGSEIKDISDSRTNIVFCMELHEKKEVMQRKDYVGKFGYHFALYTAVTFSPLLYISLDWF